VMADSFPQLLGALVDGHVAIIGEFDWS
jgi:hypothetical protein